MYYSKLLHRKDMYVYKLWLIPTDYCELAKKIANAIIEQEKWLKSKTLQKVTNRCLS